MGNTKGCEIEEKLERFRGAAKAAGVKLTHQRLEIYRELASSLGHPDAETLLRAVQGRMPTVSLDTVYRTLWMLNELGLVTTLGPRRDSIRFDANLQRHHHYVCVRCGLTRDFDSAELDELRIPEAARTFGSVSHAHVEVRGICEECARKAAGPGHPSHAQAPRHRQRSKP